MHAYKSGQSMHANKSTDMSPRRPNPRTTRGLLPKRVLPPVSPSVRAESGFASGSSNVVFAVSEGCNNVGVEGG